MGVLLDDDIGNSFAAKVYYQKHFDILKQRETANGATEGLASAIVNLCVIYSRLGEIEKVKPLLLKARELAIKEHDNHLHLIILNNLINNLVEIEEQDDNFYATLKSEMNALLSQIKICNVQDQLIVSNYMINEKHYEECKYMADQFMDGENDFTSPDIYESRPCGYT